VTREALGLRLVTELPYAAVAARLGTSERGARARVNGVLCELDFEPMLRTASLGYAAVPAPRVRSMMESFGVELQFAGRAVLRSRRDRAEG
jgi:hypothetical protein